MNMKDKKTVIVTGGMGGIGQATARAFARAGIRVILLTHGTHSKNEEIVFLNSLSGEAHRTYRCDITNTEEVAETFSRLCRDVDTIEYFVHTAISQLVRASASTIAVSDFKKQFDVGLFGGLEVLHVVIPYMKKQGSGSIVGLTTRALELDIPSKMAGYTSAKFAWKGLLKELALELAPHNIRVNAVSPSFVPTPLHRDIPERGHEFIARNEPEGILTTPHDVASVILDVCTQEEYGTGMSFPVRYGQPSKL